MIMCPTKLIIIVSNKLVICSRTYILYQWCYRLDLIIGHTLIRKQNLLARLYTIVFGQGHNCFCHSIIMWLVLILLLLLDSVYLTIIKGPFGAQIKRIQGFPIKLTQTSYLGVALTYLALAFGLKHFIINTKKNSWDAFLLGVVIYAVYEFTNLALFTNWSLLLGLIDVMWGGILFAATLYIYKLIVN